MTRRGLALAVPIAAALLASALPARFAPAAEPSEASSQAAPIKAKWVTRKLNYI